MMRVPDVIEASWLTLMTSGGAENLVVAVPRLQAFQGSYARRSVAGRGPSGALRRH